MRTLINIYILLFSLLLVMACSKEDEELVINEIPVEDRCIFTEGDVLLYSCSNGSTDTVIVIKVDFKTESGPYTAWGTDVVLHNYLTDTQSMTIESSNDNWKTILNDIYDGIDSFSNRFIIQSIPSYAYEEHYPDCEILFDGMVLGASEYWDEKIFNDKSYKKVYHIKPRGDSYEIYWNLKYGIISFMGISNGTKLIWQFEDKVL